MFDVNCICYVKELRIFAINVYDYKRHNELGSRMRWTPLSRQKIDLIKDDGPASRWMIQLRSSDQSPFLQHPFVRGLF
jgi:hypothetical protein